MKKNTVSGAYITKSKGLSFLVTETPKEGDKEIGTKIF
jgi:hypothetical protein